METIAVNTVTPSHPSTVHRLPCGIKATSRARVSTFFRPTKGASDTLEVSFRGRLLEGRKTELPESMRGLVFRETAAPVATKRDRGAVDEDDADPFGGADPFEGGMDDADPFESTGGGGDSFDKPEAGELDASQSDRHWAVHAVFDEVTYWNHDKPLAGNECIPRALQWARLAHAIHDPIDECDMEN